MRLAPAIPLVLSLLLSAPALGAPVESRTAPDILTTARAAGSFGTLLAAIERAGLEEALSGDGPYTVFAPTDEAFARLPEGTLPTLLRPESRERLRAVLAYHVVAGRVRSGDLLSAERAETLLGEHVPFGLRVGDANVVRADIECSNGVVHVIDAVLLPPQAPSMDPAGVRAVIADAVRRGAPRYNEGHPEVCARIYEEAAQRLLREAGDGLNDLDRHGLEQALGAPADDASDRAWNLRHAFDRIVEDQTFEPRMEAALPEGFPGPGPLGRVVVKHYPRYRAARAQGANPFWTLFRHIQQNDVEMTAPVEMTMGEGLDLTAMAFLYEAPDQGRAGSHGRVEVEDLAPVVVLSIGMRGSRSQEAMATARALVESRLEAEGWRRAGPWRLMGYNSPMVPSAKRFWELQVPVAR